MKSLISTPALLVASLAGLSLATSEQLATREKGGRSNGSDGPNSCDGGRGEAGWVGDSSGNTTAGGNSAWDLTSIPTAIPTSLNVQFSLDLPSSPVQTAVSAGIPAQVPYLAAGIFSNGTGNRTIGGMLSNSTTASTSALPTIYVAPVRSSNTTIQTLNSGVALGSKTAISQPALLVATGSPTKAHGTAKVTGLGAGRRLSAFEWTSVGVMVGSIGWVLLDGLF